MNTPLGHNLFPPFLVLACLASLAAASPTPCRADGSNLDPFQHTFYDCLQAGFAKTREQVPGNPACRVHYSVYKERVAVVLENPQLAMTIPEEARELEAVQTCLGKRSGSMTPLLKRLPLKSVNVHVAVFELLEPAEEEDILCLADQLEGIDGVVEAGAVAWIEDRPGEVMLLDSIRIGVTDFPSELLTGGNLRELLDAVGLRFVARDPFDPDHGLLLKAFRKPLDQRSSDSELPDDPLLGIDLMVCVLENASIDECIDTRSLQNEEDVRQALTVFRDAKPFLVAPMFQALAPDGSAAGFEAWREAQIKKEDTLGFKITFNSTTNSTDSADQGLLSVDASGTRGTYPDQFRLKLGAQVEFDDDDLEEDVTDLRVNYDYYYRPWLEFYGFVERSTNSFLSIDQRWVGGGGALFEYDWRTRTAGAVGHKDSYCGAKGEGQRGYRGRTVLLTPEGRRRLAQYRQKLRRARVQSGPISAEQAKEYCAYQPGIVKRHAKLQLGLALSLFTDFEQPGQLELTATPIDGGGLPIEGSELARTEKVAPSSSQTSRLSIRPTITWQPTDRVMLESWFYFMRSLEDELDHDDDYQTEWVAKADFELNSKDPKVLLTASYTRYFDAAPPSLSTSRALQALRLTAVEGSEPPRAIDGDGNLYSISGLTADDDHSVVKFGVSLGF